MGYLSKECVLKAFEILSKADSSQAYSAIQYFLGFDRYCKKNSTLECDLNKKSAKEEFKKYVIDIVQLENNLCYLSSFAILYTKKEKTIDSTISSNFFNGSAPARSKKAQGMNFLYPEKNALLYVKDYKLTSNKELYANISVFLKKPNDRISLAVWLLRKVEGIEETRIDHLREKLSTLYCDLLVDILLPANLEQSDIDNLIKISDSYYQIEESDIKLILGHNTTDNTVEKNLKRRMKNDPRQQIYYGAPGTGKSNEIKNLTGENSNDRIYDKDSTFRTTFHPDCDYASFVGAYKPYWDKTEGKIVYGFRPQSFLKAYIKAWKNPTKQVALVVEEINRGNCAQIFGDIFQLLDREKYGLSKYPIECDMEMQELLKDEFANETKDFGAAITDDVYADSKDNINTYYSAHYENAFEKIKNGEILALPMNLSILATMNTSDQSLFPMDSAFKRRWEWIYEPIVEGTDKDGKPLEWKIEIDNTHFVDWWNFLQKINAVIYSMTSSEDKQLGYFFCQPDKEDGETISKNLFVGKVIFYLWNEIFKDYAFEHDVCKKENKSDTLYFADFYEGKNVIKQASLEIFFNHLDEKQPKIDNKDVKLIEGKTTDTPTTEAPTDGTKEGEQSSEEANSIQNEETTTENTEA